jgi:hypothetical protein
MLGNNKLIKNIIVILLLTSTNSKSQIHHDMISSQGKTKKTLTGHYITHSIGQQSVIGNFEANGINLNQGFQQTLWSKLINSNSPNIILNYYPNPFIKEINFKFISNLNFREIFICLYDTSGKMVFNNQYIINENNELTVVINNLSSGNYLMNITNPEINHSIKFVKK